MENSLRAILKQHIRDNNPEQVTYLKDFLNSEEYTCEYIKNVPKKKMQNSDILSNSPEQIANDSAAINDLDILIHTYIKLLPFTERLNAIAEFNQLFAKGKTTCGYHLYNLRKSTNRENYCRTEDLLDGVEIEILLLKRLQIGELELILNPNGDVDTGRARNTQVRLAEEFCMSHTAIIDHIKKLKYTHNLLGYELNVNLNEKSLEYDDTTIHPIFLALNPSEAVLLTVWLKKLFEKDGGRLEQQANILADEIFNQLSNHGKKIVLDKANDVNITFDDNSDPLDSVPQHKLENYKNDIGICLKRNVHCKIKLITGEEHEGYLRSMDGYTYELRNEQGIPILYNKANGTPRKLREEDILFFNAV